MIRRKLFDWFRAPFITRRLRYGVIAFNMVNNALIQQGLKRPARRAIFKELRNNPRATTEIFDAIQVSGLTSKQKRRVRNGVVAYLEASQAMHRQGAKRQRTKHLLRDLERSPAALKVTLDYLFADSA